MSRDMISPRLAADERLKRALEFRIKAGATEALNQFKQLQTWVPECGWPDDVPPVSGNKPKPGTPFFTEAYLYELLGKEDARTVLCLMNAVERALAGEVEYFTYDTCKHCGRQELMSALERTHGACLYCLNEQAEKQERAEYEARQQKEPASE